MRARWAIVPGLVIGLAPALAGCTQTRQDITTATSFIRQANALSRRPDTTGAFPSPFAIDGTTARSDGLLSPEARREAYEELQRTGAASTAETRAREARLREISPY